MFPSLKEVIPLSLLNQLCAFRYHLLYTFELVVWPETRQETFICTIFSLRMFLMACVIQGALGRPTLRADFPLRMRAKVAICKQAREGLIVLTLLRMKLE